MEPSPDSYITTGDIFVEAKKSNGHLKINDW